MDPTNPISEELIAPCGMNCAVCSRYLAYVNHLRKSHCIGCRPRNQACKYLFAKCNGINHDMPTGDANFCFECEQYPCEQINRIDKRYRNNYATSVKANLDYIQKMGIDKFIDEQYQQQRCPECGGLISVHNQMCFKCDTVTRLVVKHNKQV
jgi:hypothetical protein